MQNRRKFLLTSAAVLSGISGLMLRPLNGAASNTVAAQPTDALQWRKLSPGQWHARLNTAQFNVLRKEGTERPFTSALLDEHRNGKFVCAGCALALFDASSKFDSHTGWPSFFQALPHAVQTRQDASLFGMTRTEVRCARCDGHLGHVFDDGPKPTGLRYCMNGVALAFKPHA